MKADLGGLGGLSSSVGFFLSFLTVTTEAVVTVAARRDGIEPDATFSCDPRI